MKIGVYVGSFNPPHEGHRKVAEYLVDNLLVDLVLLIATPNYWDKKDIIDVKHRVNMLRFYETDRIIVDEENTIYEYTYQLLKSLRKKYQNDELFLIIGADNVINLDKWKNIDDILKNKIIVLNRGDIDIESYISKFDRDRFIVVQDFPYIPVSSTQIRTGDYNHLDERVKQYIKQNNLYT